MASANADDFADEVSVDEAHAMMQSGEAPVLVDLRTREQHSAYRPTGAVSLPAGAPGSLGLLFRFDDGFVADVGSRFGREQPLLLLCDVGVVSRFAAAKLLDAGHTSVRAVAGGFEAWTLGGGLPVERDEGAQAAMDAAAEEEQEVEGPLPEPEPWVSTEDGFVLEACPRGVDIGEMVDDTDDDLGTMLMDDDLAEFEETLTEGSAAAEAELAGAGPPPPPPPPAAPEPPLVNALAGDELDDDLASLVAELDAPVALAGGGQAPLSSGRNGFSTPLKSMQAAKKRKGRSSGIAPAWLVDVSSVDFGGLAASGKLSKLSVKELKSFLYHREEILSGNKAELAERVAKCISDGGLDGDGGAGGSGGGDGGAGGSGGGEGDGDDSGFDMKVGGGGSSGANGMFMSADAAEAQLESNMESNGAGTVAVPAAASGAGLGVQRDADDLLIDEIFSAM